jgi:hypothetical protein
MDIDTGGLEFELSVADGRIWALEQEIVRLLNENTQLRAALAYAVGMGVQADVEGDRVTFTEAACGCCAVPLKKENPHIEVFRQAALSGKGE